MVVGMVGEKAREDLSGDVEEEVAPIDVADLAVPFALIELDDYGVIEVLDLSSGRVKSCFTAPYWFRVKRAGVRGSRHLRLTHTGDGAEYGEGAVEDASEMSGSSLRNLRLLRERGTSAGAEKRTIFFGCGIVDSLDPGKKVLPFVAVHVSLDLLGVTSRPGLLYLPQPLLHKAATTAEGCIVVVSRTNDLGYAQSVLPGEYVADGGVIFFEPVLVLAVCATADSQGRRLNCVPESASLVLGRGVLLDGGGDRKSALSLS
ncbi:hypothetical protein SprV_0301181300 [Sparganum proliferum]